MSQTLTTTLSQLSREQTLLSTSEVVEVLGVTPWWVRRLINDGELRAINIGGYEKAKRWHVDPEDLNAFMVARQSRPRDLVA